MKSTMSMIRRPITNLSQSKISGPSQVTKQRKGYLKTYHGPMRFGPSLYFLWRAVASIEIISPGSILVLQELVWLYAALQYLFIEGITMLDTVNRNSLETQSTKSFVQLQVSLCIQNLLGSLLPLSFLLLVLRSLR